MSRVFLSGGTGVLGGALLARLRSRGDEVVALARSEAASHALERAGASVVPGDVLDEDALARAMAGCTVGFHLAGVNAFCQPDPGPMRWVNVDGAVFAVRAAARAGLPRLVLTSSAATLGEPAGTIGSERTPHRGWYLSGYERTKTEGERAAQAAARELGVELVCVNPSSVQGPGRASGTGRFLIAFLDGRMRVFVRTHVSLVDIADCTEGHLLAAEHGQPGERYVLNGLTMPIADALELAASVAGVRTRPRFVPRALAGAGAALAELGFRAAGRHPPVCREMVRTLLHGHRYDGSRAERELGLRYTDPRETLRHTVDWARAQGLIRAPAA